MCPPLLAAIPAAISALSAVGGTVAAAGGAAGTFLGLSSAAWGGIGLASGLAGAGMQAYGQVQAGKQQQQAAKYNQQIADFKALDEERRGSMAESQNTQRTRALVGSVEARQGSSGVIAGDGTGADVLTDIAEYGARDTATIHANAQRAAWGIRAQGAMDYQKAYAAGEATKSAGYSTFMKGVTEAATSNWWDQWKPKTDPFAGQKADVSWSGY